MSLFLREEVILNQSENAWVPTTAKIATKYEVSKTNNEEEHKNDDLNKDVRSILNKITTDNMLSLTEHFKALPIDTIQRLERTIDLVFEKAIEEHSFAPLCASLCSAMKSVQVNSKDGETASFKKLIIDKCQNLFELDKAQEISSAMKLTEINSCKDPEKKKELQIAFEENERRLRKRFVGNRRFIGELFKQKIVTPNIMFYCIVNLVTACVEVPLECICNLLKTVGKELEQSYELNFIFDQLKALTSRESKSKISSRIKFMIQDVIDLRRDKWIPRSTDSNHYKRDDKVIGEENKSHSMFITQSTRPLQMTNLPQGPQNPLVANMSNAQNFHGQSPIVQSQPMDVALNTQPMQQVPQQPSTTPMQIPEGFRHVKKRKIINKIIDPYTGREIALNYSLQRPPTSDEMEKMKVLSQFQSQGQSAIKKDDIKSSVNNPVYLPGNVVHQGSYNHPVAAYYPLNPQQPSQTAIPKPYVNYPSNQQVKSKIERNMSLSLREEVILNQTENAWVPTAAKSATTSEVSKTKNEEEHKNDDLNKDVRSILNKITTDNMFSLTERFKALPIDTIQRLESTIDLVFEKAIEEHSFAPLCASLCSAMKSVQVNSNDGETASFKKLIIDKCHNLFELDKTQKISSAMKLTEINSCKDPEKKKELQIEFEENERRLHKRFVGNRRFIGELFKQKFVTPSIMFFCIVNLVTKRVEAPLECICNLLKTVGKELEQSYDLNFIFDKLKALTSKERKSKISFRIKSMIQDVIDLRRNKWISRSTDSNHHQGDDKVIGEENKSHSMFITQSTRPLQMTNLPQGPQNPLVANMSNAQNFHGQSLIVQSQPMDMALNTQPMQQVPQQPSTTPMQIPEGFGHVKKRKIINKIIDPTTGREIALNNSLQRPPTSDEMEKMKFLSQFQSQGQSAIKKDDIKSSVNNPPSQTAIPMSYVNYPSNQQGMFLTPSTRPLQMTNLPQGPQNPPVANISNAQNFHGQSLIVQSQPMDVALNTQPMQQVPQQPSTTPMQIPDGFGHVKKRKIINQIIDPNIGCEIALNNSLQGPPTSDEMEKMKFLSQFQSQGQSAIKKDDIKSSVNNPVYLPGNVVHQGSYNHPVAAYYPLNPQQPSQTAIPKPYVNYPSNQQVKSKIERNMSLSLREEVILNQTENAWVPTAAKSATTSEVSKTKNEEEHKNDDLNKDVRSILNKITTDNMFSLTERFKALPIDTIQRLESTIDLVFEKAIEEHSFAPLCASLCSAMKSVQVNSNDGETASFKKLIIDKCHNLFELDKTQKISSAMKLTEINSCKDPEKKKELQIEFEENERRLHKRFVGNRRFIGELFKQKFVTPSIMFFCIVNLVTKRVEAPLECICNLLKTVGKELEQSYDLNFIFDKLKALTSKERKSKISFRIKSMIQDVIDLRRNKWISRSTDSNHHQGDDKVIGEENKSHSMFITQSTRPLQMTNLPQGPQNPLVANMSNAQNFHGQSLIVQSQPMDMALNTQPMQQVPQQPSTTPMQIPEGFGHVKKRKIINKIIDPTTGREIALNNSLQRPPTSDEMEKMKFLSQFQSQGQSAIKKDDIKSSVNNPPSQTAIPMSYVNYPSNQQGMFLTPSTRPLQMTNLPQGPQNPPVANISNAQNFHGQSLIVQSQPMDVALNTQPMQQIPQQPSTTPMQIPEGFRHVKKRKIINKIIDHNTGREIALNNSLQRPPTSDEMEKMKFLSQFQSQGQSAIKKDDIKSSVNNPVYLPGNVVHQGSFNHPVAAYYPLNPQQPSQTAIPMSYVNYPSNQQGMFLTPSTRPLQMTNLPQGPQNPPVANISNAQNFHGQSLIVQSQPMDVALNTQPMQQVPQKPSTTLIQIPEAFQHV